MGRRSAGQAAAWLVLFPLQKLWVKDLGCCHCLSLSEREEAGGSLFPFCP